MDLTFLRDRVFLRDMLALAIPVAFQQLITASLNMIDVLMVGQLGPRAPPEPGVQTVEKASHFPIGFP